MSLTVIVPSKGRPQNILRVAEAFQRTCTLEDTRLLFVVDEVSSLPEFGDAYKAFSRAIEMVRPPTATAGMVAALNYAAVWMDKTVANTDYIGFFGDDMIPQTVGWDARFVASLKTHLFVYGNDLLQGEKIATEVAMHASVVRALGYMAPPEMFHLCIDLVWGDWGRELNSIEYLDDVVIEHQHPANGKAELDEGYRRVNAPSVVASDSALYYEYRDQGRLQRDVEKLRGLARDLQGS